MKLPIRRECPLSLVSPPTRGRGLKLSHSVHHRERRWVAPHAGAWIETSPASLASDLVVVAPHAGAWIET